MKRKLFKVVLLVVVVSAAIGWNFSQNKSKTQMSELTLANIDALAFSLSEWDGTGWVCFSHAKDTGGDLFFTYTRCSDCSSSSATSVGDRGSCNY